MSNDATLKQYNIDASKKHPSGKIFSAIPKIMATVGSIAKTRKNQSQGYAFRGIDDVYEALQKLLAENGVFFSPQVLEYHREEKQTKNGGVLTVTIIRCEFTFYADDGTYFKSITLGEGMDSGDKSSNKAMSAAVKYALLEVFCIPTSEPKDSEDESPEIIKNAVRTTDRPLSEAQLKRLFAISKKCGWAHEDIKDYLGKLGMESTKELSWVAYEHFIDLMEKYPKEPPE